VGRLGLVGWVVGLRLVRVGEEVLCLVEVGLLLIVFFYLRRFRLGERQILFLLLEVLSSVYN
jgi:hypothetical protein